MDHLCVEPYETFVANLKQALYPKVVIVKTEGNKTDGLVTLHLQSAGSKWQLFWLGCAAIGTITDEQTRTHEGKFDLAAKRATDIVPTINRFIDEHSALSSIKPHHNILSRCNLCFQLENERKAQQAN